MWLPLLAISAAAVWYVVAVFVPHERSAAIEVWRGRLSAMADDRKAAITSWLGHRLGDAKVVAEYPTVVYLLSGQHTEPYLFPRKEGPRRHVQRLLDSMQGAHGYRAAYVLDAGGNVVVDGTGSPPLEPACRASVARVLSLGHPEVDLHAHADGLPMLAITAPVRVADRTVGAVLLSDDPARWLYPLLLSEPIPTRTGESLLAHQVGNQVEFLSPLRHRSTPPLSFRLPFALPLLAVAAIRGEEGFRSYFDYRGARVLGVARRIPGTGWGLVVKVDEDEAFSAFRRSVRDVALAWACVLLALAGLGFGAWRTQAASYRAHLGESEARFALLRDHANDAILFASRDGVILDVNRKAEESYFRRREELLGLPFDELRAPEERAALRDRVDALARDDELVFEAIHRRSDGTRFPVEVSIRVTEIRGQDVLVSIVRDMTERKRVEEALREAEERFRIASETSNDVVYEWDLEQSVQWFGNIDEMLGYGPGEFPRTLDGWAASVNPEDLERVMAAVRAHLETQVPYAIEYRVRKKDGTYRWWTARGAATRTPDRRPVRWIGTITDITERKRVEEALRESEDRFKYVFEHSSLGKSLTRPTGEIQVNRAFAEMLGYSLAEMAAKRWQEISHPDDVADTQRVVDSLLSGEREFARFTKRYIHKNGSVVWGDVATSVRRDKTGAPMYFMTAVSDITERKEKEAELAAAQQLYRELFESVNIGILRSMPGPEGAFIDVNPAMVKMFEADSREQLIALHPSEIYWDGSQRKIVSDAIVAKGFVEEEVRFKTLKGKEIWCHINGVRKFDAGGRIYFDSTIEDITQRKRAEEEIRKLNAELEERVQQRTAQLEAANKELEAFSYSVSHDLRAPLRAIDGFSRIVIDDYGDRLDDEGKRQLDVICANTQKMGRLIDDLLAFSRAGRAELHRTRITMSQLVHAAFSEAAPSPAECGRIDLSVGELPDAWADPALMRQVWVNLLSNAVKFSRPRERAVIHVTGALEDARVVYHVSDNGVGFDMRYVQRLFGVFQRLHTSREFEGTGVGLALVQRIVHRHGGVVWAEGVVNSGATFSFALPEEGSHE